MTRTVSRNLEYVAQSLKELTYSEMMEMAEVLADQIGEVTNPDALKERTTVADLLSTWAGGFLESVAEQKAAAKS